MRKVFATILLLLATFTATSQGLRIVALNERLDKVLKNSGIEVSFDSRAMSRYRVSIDRGFASPQAAIEYLLADKPFQCKQIGGVYVISPKPKPTVAKVRSIPPAQEELPRIKVVQLGEVIVTAPLPVYSPKSGDVSAEATIDHRTARYMPGSGDNSVFNLLRMMPGVRASGEPSDELIVWGSTSGESRIIFDGIPLFGMRGFNDNISFINPYLVREIRLMKGGYGADYGNQIGAIAEVRGNEPNTVRPSVKASVSTLTANIFASTPITKRSALSVAYRRTFYDLYKSGLLNPYNDHRGAMSGRTMNGVAQSPDIYIVPDYSFADMNVNFSGRAFENDSYRIALYGADDRFGFTAQPATDELIKGQQNSRQAGISANYKRGWNAMSQSRIEVAFSRFNTTDERTNVLATDNLAQLLSVKLSQNLSLKNNELEAGVELDSYTTDNRDLLKPTIYLSDNITINNLSLNTGIRIDFLTDRVNLQPRLSASYRFTEMLTATASWGLYNQYISRLPYKVANKNYTMIWGMNDRLSAMHTIAGVSYRSPSGFSATVEGYVKNLKNAVRIVDETPVTTDVDIYGGDIFLKYDFQKGTLFGSYSLSNIRNGETGHELKFGTLITLKPFILSASYVYGSGFSVTDLSGMHSGYGNMHGGGRMHGSAAMQNLYSRLDIAATYRLRFNKFQLQAGATVVNLFNTQNLKYSYTVQNNNDPITLYSGAIPFTPMLFFEIIW